MYRFWNTIIEPALQTIHPLVMVEIGVGEGLQTKLALEYCKKTGATLHGIDPMPHIPVSEWLAAYAPHFVFHQEMSLNVLGDIENVDAVLIDGDHNWYTVYHELLLLEKRAIVSGTFPLIFLHDTSWPYGRRDLYYTPDTIPAAFKKAHAKKGLSPFQKQLLEEDGINAHLDNAIEENNLQNGVLTAIEDFLAQSRLSLRFMQVPGLHGLGIIASQEMVDAHPDLSAFLHGMNNSPAMQAHLDTMEKERVQFLMRLNQEKGNAEVIHSLNNALDEIEEERQTLLEELNFLKEEQETLRDTLKKTQDEKERMAHYLTVITQEANEKKEELNHLQEEKEKLSVELETLNNKYRLLEQKKVRDVVQHAIKPAPVLPPKPETTPPTLRLIFSALKRAWVAIGEPFPGLTRFIRHRLIGSLIAPPKTFPAVLATVSTDTDLSAAAALILCTHAPTHLVQTINSVLIQSVTPQEIVVIDTQGSKETAAICDTFAPQQVRLVAANPAEATATGLRVTQAPVLLFVDADAVLHPEYLRASLRLLSSRHDADMTYTDQQFFGGAKDKVELPTFWSLQDLERHQPPLMVWTARRTSLLSKTAGMKPADHWIGIKNNGIYFHRIDTSSPLSRV